MQIIEYLHNIDIYSWQSITILILAGFLVGLINTFAGNGTALTYSLFLAMGFDATIANGTPRLGVVMQTLAASLSFKKKKILELKTGIILGIPTVLGSVVGAQIAVSIDKSLLEKIIALLMILMLFFILYKPEKWIKGKNEAESKKMSIIHLLVYFLIGIYGGFIHIGVGILLLFALVMISGFDIIKANALKVFIVLLYSPFSLLIFMFHNQVEYAVGLISSIGNLFGGIIAAYFAITWGGNFLKWFLISIILISSSYSLGVLDFFYNLLV